MKNNFNWTEYYKCHENSKTTFTLESGLKYFNNNKQSLSKNCIDIGCGQGIDTGELLKQGWDVIAIDKEKEAKTIMLKKFSKYCNKNLKIIIEPMEKITIPKVSLINASFSLPFCNPNNFLALWNKIISNISPGGIFCGQLFGPDDSWASNKNMTFHNRNLLDSLFNNFIIHYLHEENKISKTATGEVKNWHVFHLVAVKQK